MNYLFSGLGQVFNLKQVSKDSVKPGNRGVQSYLLVLLLVQVASFFVIYAKNLGTFSIGFEPSAVNIISLIAGIAGVLNVVLVAQGKMTNYFWGLINTIAYIWVSYQQHLTGEVCLNAYFFIMQFIGAYAWAKGNDESGKAFTANSLTKLGYLSYIVAIAIAWFGMYQVIVTFPTFFGGVDPHPIVDSLCFALQIIAQVLMTYQYAEQWVLWCLADVFEIVLWSFPNNLNPVMIALWSAFLINSLIGAYAWFKQAGTLNKTESSNLKNTEVDDKSGRK